MSNGFEAVRDELISMQRWLDGYSEPMKAKPEMVRLANSLLQARNAVEALINERARQYASRKAPHEHR